MIPFGFVVRAVCMVCGLLVGITLDELLERTKRDHARSHDLEYRIEELEDDRRRGRAGVGVGTAPSPAPNDPRAPEGQRSGGTSSESPS